MPDHPTPASAIARLNALAEADRRRARAVRWGARYRRIAPAALSPQGRRTLDWLAEWDEPTIEGLVEILGAVRTAAEVVDRRPKVDGEVEGLRSSEAATEAALAQCDDRRGVAR